MVLKVYGDELSDPTRAVLAFLKLNQVPFEFIFVNLWKGEQLAAEYLQVNPMGKVPAIDDDGFKLAESHAIMAYIHATRRLPDHWYPSEIKARAMVDRYLHWHHSNLRVGEALIFANVIAPALGLSINLEQVSLAQDTFLKSLSMLDRMLTDHNFLAGAEISLADLSAACEIAEHRLRNFDLSHWPYVQEWMARVFTLPEVQEVHRRLDEFAVAKHP
jgi:glutathione S-transferase